MPKLAKTATFAIGVLILPTEPRAGEPECNAAVLRHMVRVSSTGASARVKEKIAAYMPKLLEAVQREARRRGINWMVLLAIAEVETRYQWWRVRKTDSAYGPYQITAWHGNAIEAGIMIKGCKAGVGLCEAPRIAELRKRIGRWGKSELRNPYINTYIAAYGIRKHVLWCYRHHKRGHRSIGKCPRWLSRWGHYQSGINKPSYYYVKRLCAAYMHIKSACKGNTP